MKFRENRSAELLSMHGQTDRQTPCEAGSRIFATFNCRRAQQNSNVYSFAVQSGNASEPNMF